MAPTPNASSLDERLAMLSDIVLARVPARHRTDIDRIAAADHMRESDADPRTDVVAWDNVSQALREFHASAQRDFAAASAQLETLDAQTQQQLQLLETDRSYTVDDHVSQIHADVSALLHELGASERHFRDVAALVAPAQRNLEALEARAAYFRAALEVERLSQHARAEAVQATRGALDAFQALSSFVAELPPEFTHVRATAERRIAALTRDLKTFALEKLEAALEAIAWPAELAAEELQHKSSELSAVAQAFAYLLALQLSQERAATNATATSAAPTTPLGVSSGELWAINTLLHAITVRFRYHFERAESQTNRLAKPEWFLSHVVAQVRAHAPFLHSVISPELEKQRAWLPCCDAQVLLLRGLVLSAQRKLRKDIPSLLSQHALLCHTLDEVLLFEQELDDAFAYASWANSHRALFPRCVDAFTDHMPVFIAWTSVDVDYAKRMLAHEIFENRAKAWAIELDDDYGDAADTSSGSERAVPRGALHAVSLLDFLCRRFAVMASEEHRFLYLTHVHHVLLRELLRECESRARMINIHGAGANVVTAVREICAVVNAAQYVVAILSTWEQTSMFLELTKKVAQSDTSRSQVLRIHLAYSKSVLQNAAHAASSAVLAREEAVAVRQAIAGPGSLIGPTAAFSAAYSVGSKTVRSLLGRADAASAAAGDSGAKPDGAVEATIATDSDEAAAQAALNTEEELVFSRSIFERQIADFKGLTHRLLRSVSDTVVAVCRHDVKLYPQSLFTAATNSSTGDATLTRDVSPELGASLALLGRVLTVAHALLSGDSCSQLAKSIATALDELLFDAVVHVSDAHLHQSASALTPQARAQFAFDVSVLGDVLELCAPRSRKYLRRATDLLHLFALEASQVRELRSALSESDGRAVAALEQITTMLEVCRIVTMTPEHVLAVSDQMVW